MIRDDGVFEWRGERAKIALAVLLGVLPLGTLACGDTANEIRAKMEDERAREAQPVSSEVTPEPETVSVQTASLETVGSSTPPTLSREVSFEEAESVYRDRRFDEAVVLFSSYVHTRPENAWGHYMLGLSQWKAGSLEEAERSFTTALDIDPEHAKSLVNLSRVLLEQGRAEDAIETARRAVDLDGESTDAIRQLARAQSELGQVEDAIGWYREAILLDTDDVWSLNNLGYLLIREKRFEEAVGPLARATELREDQPLFFNNLGMALERSGHVFAARDAYRTATEVGVGYAKAHGNLERVESIRGVVDTEIDLADHAARFLEELERLRSEGVEPIDTEPVGIVEPDLVSPPVLEVPVQPDTLGTAPLR